MDGKLISNEFKHEDKDKVLIKEYDYKNDIPVNDQGSLLLFNNAYLQAAIILKYLKL